MMMLAGSCVVVSLHQMGSMMCVESSVAWAQARDGGGYGEEAHVWYEVGL